MRFRVVCGQSFSTEVVLFTKLGENEVFIEQKANYILNISKKDLSIHFFLIRTVQFFSALKK
jgi:hypothetical protein